jgi:hypothetical protein
MKEECATQTEVSRFLGACEFYHIWIPHYAYIAESVYRLLKKDWMDERVNACNPEVKGAIIGGTCVTEGRLHERKAHLHDRDY